MDKQIAWISDHRKAVVKGLSLMLKKTGIGFCFVR
jgi:hypothetical protein